jgi:hypothetical protein
VTGSHSQEILSTTYSIFLVGSDLKCSHSLEAKDAVQSYLKCHLLMFQTYNNALELVKKFPAVTISHTTKKNNFVKLICPLTVKMKKTTHVHNRNKSQPKIGTFILTKTNGTIPA